MRRLAAAVTLLLLAVIALGQDAFSQGAQNPGITQVTDGSTTVYGPYQLNFDGTCTVSTGSLGVATVDCSGGGGGGNPGGPTNSVQYKVSGTTFGGVLLGDAQVLVGQTSAAPSAVTISGDATLADTGALSVVNLSNVTNASLANSGLVHPSLTIAGHVVALGGSQAIACADLTVPCITANQMITLSGDTTGSGTTAITTTTGKVDGVTYPSGPSANTVPVVTSATSGGTVTYEAVPNAALANAATTVNGQTCTLGSTCTVTAAATGITVGTTTVSGGTNTYILYNNSGVLGNEATVPTANGGLGAANGSATGIPGFASGSATVQNPTGAVKNSGGTLSQAACADLSNGGSGCSATVNSSTSGNAAYYSASSATISGSSGLTLSSSAILNYIATITTVSSTACTLGTSSGCSGGDDCGTMLYMTGTSAVITIPATLAAGCQVAIVQAAATQVSITGSAVAAATLHTPHSFAGKTAGQYSTIGVSVVSNSGGSSAVAVMTGDGA